MRACGYKLVNACLDSSFVLQSCGIVLMAIPESLETTLSVADSLLNEPCKRFVRLPQGASDTATY